MCRNGWLMVLGSMKKVPGLFGRLAICLPSEHVGGDVCLRYDRYYKRLFTAKLSAFSCSILAWNAGVMDDV
ncbi:hypothetical protein F5883DRAFT_567164, partial [Diaporthe sp. PMI_573]